MIKCIALDFDGTIANYTPGKPWLSAALFGTLERFIEKGGLAGIVTGRDLGSLRDAVTSGGFQWQKPFPSFAGVSESYLILPGDVFADRNRQTKERIMQTNRLLLGCAAQWLELLGETGFEVTGWKISHDYSLEYTFAEESEARRAEVLIREKAAEAVPGCRVHRNCRQVSVMDSLSEKGRLVAEAADYYALSPYEVLVIGDSGNDASMFDRKYGFLCGTPENGDTEIKEEVLVRGGYVGSGNAYDGVLDIFREYKKQGLLEI